MNFAEEAWNNLAEYEHGRDFEDLEKSQEEPKHEEEELSRENNTNIRNYLELKEKIKDYPELIEWFQDVLSYGARYTEQVALYEYQVQRLTDPNADFSSRVELENVDEARRHAHNALVDSLKIFSRAANKRGLEFKFIYDIMSGSNEIVRNNVRKWVTDVLDYEALKGNS